MNIDMASSSSLPPPEVPPQEKYDVFLSFRGEDTRDTFTSHLYAALRRKKVETFIDCELKKGDTIDPALLEAIEKSKLGVIIFSKNYATSTWCLDELVHILGCKKRYGQIVIPIFYGINPSHVRKQEESYAEAFRQLEERFKDRKDKVDEWRDALMEAACISGFDNSKKTGTEADFVEKVVEDILTKLWPKSSSDDLKRLVGIERKIQQIESLLNFDSPGVCCVGIWGRGGIGKSTLADAVFLQLSSKFEASCFLPNVREGAEKHGLEHLRNVLLREILNKNDINIQSLSIPTSIQIQLKRTEVLIVLDDVNDPDQLEFLVGDPHDLFCGGSRIIITTRDRGVLKKVVNDNKMYKVEELNSNDALDLFYLRAFKNKGAGTNYAELSKVAVDYAGGIPLALRILGDIFFGCKSKKDWEDELKELEKFPNKRIENVFRLSYDRLEENEKGIFLDIACYLKGLDIELVKAMVDLHDFSARGLNILLDMSLISISTRNHVDWFDESVSTINCVEMHDKLQKMGRTIVCQQSTEPGRRDRLWDAEEICGVLETNTGSETVQSIFFDTSATTELQLSGAPFRKMVNLKLLKIYDSRVLYHGRWQVMSPLGQLRILRNKPFKNSVLPGLQSLPNSLKYFYWEGYPSKSIPSQFSTVNLVELRMPYSKVVGKIWRKGQKLGNLKVIDLSRCELLTEVPDLSGSPELEHINLRGCTSLVQIPSYFKDFNKLTFLNLGFCWRIKHLPEMPGNIESLDLYSTGIKELPSSVWSLEKIRYLNVAQCRSLENLPSNSCNLKVSGTFRLSVCTSLRKFSELPRYISELDMSWTAIEVLPSSIGCLSDLTTINLSHCRRLVSLPTSICKLKSLRKFYLSHCYEFQYFPESLEPIEHLEILSLDRAGVKQLPSWITQAAQLSHLCLIDCKRLESVPELPPLLHRLEADGCTSLKTVSSSSTALAQGWDRYIFSPGLHEEVIFSNCPKLDQNATSNIMADARPRILRMATASSKYRKEKIEEASRDSDWELEETSVDSAMEKFGGRSSVVIRCSGYEIPNWFNHQNEGSSINIKLPPDWFNADFLGFAYSLVAYNNSRTGWSFDIGCKYNFKTKNGESHEIKDQLNDPSENGSDSRHVFVWWYDVFEVAGGTKCSTDFYKLVTEVSIDFYDEVFDADIIKCGICMLYAQDAEVIKLFPWFIMGLREHGIRA